MYQSLKIISIIVQKTGNIITVYMVILDSVCNYHHCRYNDVKPVKLVAHEESEIIQDRYVR